ncbi:MAG TPA: CDP-alcohol phosphatidyltransferase family protein [Flavobacteriales bacterium]|nr:CDP-alcohol phosphatidyltransferase family protein [Flavobacteriales bacterium]HMR26318.1 CDP-alcohol phosphatidyltransferase family protein [Flavobacteriales bacterium]
MARLPRLPDLLTTANLACGVLSILLASQGQLTAACWLVFAAALFDVFDGLAARALGGGTPLGAQLDSLADMVSFGVAPAFIAAIDPAKALHRIISAHRDFLPVSGSGGGGSESLFGDPFWMSGLTTGILCIASCWRLARFNIDTRQTSGFMGLATPANALFWISIALTGAGAQIHPGPFAETLHAIILEFAHSPIAKMLIALVLGILMLSELPLPSLKFKHFRWPGNQVIYLLGGIGAVLVVLYGILAVPLILLLYLLSPLWGKLFR